MADEIVFDNKNEKATDLLEKIFQSWEKVRYDQETDTEYRKPITKEQMDNSQLWLDEVKAINSDDEWVQGRVKELQSVVDSQNKREYQGLKYIPIAIILYSLLYIIPSFFNFNPNIALSIGQKRVEGKISYLNKFISSDEYIITKIRNGSGEYADLSEKKREKEIVKQQKYIKKHNKKIEKLQNISNMRLIIKSWFNALITLILGIIFFVTGINYKKALSPPQYLRDFREIKANKDQTDGKSMSKLLIVLGAIGAFLVSIYFKISSFLMKQDASITTRKTYSDGHTEDETVINPFPVIGIAMYVGAFVSLVGFMAIVSPIFVGYNYMNNYVWYK